MPTFLQILIILGTALILVPLAKRIGLSTVLGFLVSGLVLGPSLLNVAAPSLRFQMTEYGMLMLMFLIGLGLKPTDLWPLLQPRFKLGALFFVACSSVITVLVFLLLQQSLVTSVVIGTALALSSHFLVIQQLSARQQLNSVTGQHSASNLLVQTLLMAALLIILPLYSLIQNSSSHALAYLASCIAALSGLYLLNRYVLQPAIAFMQRHNARELIMPMGLFMLLGSIALLHALGIHSALAALLAGMLLADSIHRDDIEQYTRPLKGFLIGIFFIAIGMQLELQLFTHMPIFIVAAALSLVLFKIILSYALCHYFKYPMQQRLRLALGLAQAGEFSMILLIIATQQQLMSVETQSLLLMIIALSMALTPVLNQILERWLLPSLQQRQSNTFQDNAQTPPTIVIAGFGRFGQIVARVAHRHALPIAALDPNVELQYFDAPEGIRVYAADPRQPAQLQQAGIETARLFVLAVDDVEDSLMIARHVRLNYPNLNILARARDRYHLHLLRDLGITQIWRESYLSSLGMAYSALCTLGISEQQAQRSIDQFRDSDALLLDQQQRIYTDETKVYQSYPHVMAELALLFQRDAEDLIAQQQIEQADTEHTQVTQHANDHLVKDQLTTEHTAPVADATSQRDSNQHNRMNIQRK